eukprot:gene12319-2965_t
MKKLRTYGKHGRREVFVKRDKFSEIIDESFSSSPVNVAFNAANGWCRPKIVDLSADLFNNSLDDDTLSSEDHSILKYDERSGAKNDAEKYYTASTPCTTQTFDASSLLQDSSCKSSPVSSKIHRSQISFFEALTPYRLAKQIDPASNNQLQPVWIEQQCTAKEKVLAFCGQQSIIDFSDYMENKSIVKKIGEGVYGEVYETIFEEEHFAIKIVPVEGDLKVNGQTQKGFKDMLTEIAISKELSALNEKDEHGNQITSYIRVHRTVCCKGCYPSELLMAWLTWDDEQKSENDNPSMLNEDQIFVIFETELGGKSLEDYKRINFSIAKSILYQVTAALAVGEKALKFEHRDLHWGNLLIRSTRNSSLPFHIENESRMIETAGVQVDIIDFTLSRLDKDDCVVFCNLEEEEDLFQGSGDYQFDIYRMMQEENNNQWTDFHPRTNVMWIHYLAEKIISDKLKRGVKKISSFSQRILTYNSAFELLNDEFFTT